MDIAALVPDWPEWAMKLLTLMAVLLVVVLVTTSLISSTTKGTSGNNGVDKQTTEKLEGEFNAFKRQYLTVYMIIMLADWMQGTHMYTLYLSYGVNISALFLTGFFSGAVFAPFLGSLVDKYGRKRSCIVYCVLEIIINTLEHSTDFPTLLFGRVLGGISTNLLFSAFEAWMVTEHHRRKFPESWLSKTFSSASVLNGSMAVFAGIVAQLLEDQLGQIGPFQGAIALTFVAMLFVLGWGENYGEENEDDRSSGSLLTQLKDGWKTTMSDSLIFRIGMTQALSEGAMYTFVFMWVPTLLSLDPPGGLPTGCVFSSLMIAITIGGVLYPVLERVVANILDDNRASEMSAAIIYMVASTSMAIPAYCIGSGSGGCFENILFSFVLVEICVGLFMPVSGKLRSKYVPDNMSGAILNIFRLPLNAVVVGGTYATDYLEHKYVFMMVSGCFMVAALLQLTMVGSKRVTVDSDKKKS